MRETQHLFQGNPVRRARYQKSEWSWRGKRMCSGERNHSNSGDLGVADTTNETPTKQDGTAHPVDEAISRSSPEE